MASDMGDGYREWRVRKQANNARRYERNEALRVKLPDHVRVQVFGNGQHWRVTAHGLTVDYWPSSGAMRELLQANHGMKRDTVAGLVVWMEKEGKRRAAEDRKRAAQYADDLPPCATGTGETVSMLKGGQ